MYAVGIVAEFDPFHKGHEYIIRAARGRGATHIAVVMSGASVQRGEIAVCTKQQRADAALKCGADIVAELPAPCSCSSAGYFADSAVRILGQLSIDALCFGSETDDAESIVRAAEALDELDDSELVRKHIGQGMSYPAALQAAVTELYGEKTAAAVGTPNSTLGVEYVRALKHNGICADILPVKRAGSEHDRSGGEFPSGSELREILLRGRVEDISGRVPYGCEPEELFDPSRAGDIMLYRLLTAEKEELMRLPEINEPIADRVIKVRRDPPPTLEGFLAAVKTSNVTLARLRRSALHIALGVTKEDIVPPPYVRLLAFNGRGTELLRRAKGNIPVSASLRELEQSSPAAARMISTENRAVRLQQMCNFGGERCFKNEYTRKIVIKK